MSRLEHIVIRASAGSGKTYQLAIRYLTLLAMGVQPGRILATTFTRKAAGEIFDRVIGKLAEAAVDDARFAALHQDVAALRSPAHCAEALRSLIDSLDRLHILTLDSFFMRLADCYSLDLELTPGWRIAEEEEDAGARTAAISEALAGGDYQQWAALFHMLAGGALKRSVHAAYQRAVDTAHIAYLQGERRVEPWRVFGPASPPLDNAALDAACAALARLELPTTKRGNVHSTWQKALDKSCEALAGEDWEEFLNGGIAGALESGVFAKVEIPPHVHRAFEPLVGHARAVLLHHLKCRNQATFDLVHSFQAKYVAAKQAAGAYTFDDVPRLLLDSALVEETQDLYYRLDGQLDHVLLDEFQDTSLTQYRLLFPLLDEMLSRAAGENSVFCVGDAKQSLYMWREAEPELLMQLRQRWATFESMNLSKSYRSAPPIMQVVNDVFGNLDQSEIVEHSEALSRWQKMFEAHSTAKTDLAGYVVLRSAPVAAEDCNTEEQRQRTLEYAVEIAAKLHTKAPTAEIGVLLRKRKWVDEAAQLLAEQGIEVSKEAGNPLSDSPPVAAAVALLHFLDHPGDTAAAYHVAISPFGPHVGLEAPFEPGALRIVHGHLRRRIEHGGYAAFFAGLLRVSVGDMDAQGCERFEQFITLAAEADAEPTLRTTGLIERAETRKIESAGPGAARVMTIHGSKGLEFDIVILPELDAPWQLMNDAVLTLRPTLDSPVTEASCYAKRALRACHPGLERLHRQNLNREVLEELCCLYVAMTRARRHLELIVPPTKPRGTTAASVLKATLARESKWEEECVFYQRAQGDWMGQMNAEAGAGGEKDRVPSEERPVVLAGPTTASASRWQRRSPSSLEGGQAVSLLDALGVGSGAAKERGTLMHAWCELIDWLDNGEPSDEALLAVAAREGFSPTDVVADLAAFGSALKEPVIQQLLSRSAYAERVETGDALRVVNERAFAVRDVDPQRDEPVLLTGRFDRVVVCERASRTVWAEIIDFKTDSVAPADGAALDERVAYYTPQMRAYQRAAAKVWRLPVAAITARLAFFAAGAVVDI